MPEARLVVGHGQMSEQTLEDTVARARQQVEDKGYAAGLVGRGIAPERIRTYGIAFRGKEVLVG